MKTLQSPENLQSDKLHEECGVFGIFSSSKTDVAKSVFYGLFALQHRGQEGCGICVNDKGIFSSYKDLGLLNEVFNQQTLENLGEGTAAVGHVRYGTTGATNRLNCQPLEVHHIKGSLALCHNGNLTNTTDLRTRLELEGSVFHTSSDSEVIANAIIKQRLSCDCIEDAVQKAMEQIKGAYSLAIMTQDKMLAVRDPLGMRPLCIGKTGDGSYVVSSESCALTAIKAQFVRDVEPGEIVVFSRGETFDQIKIDSIQTLKNIPTQAVPKKALCVFEYIYFARADSVIDGVSVQQARQKAGMFLADEHPVDADVVIGVPDSGLDAALGYAMQSKIPYGLGFVKNKYIGRTFIAPQQKERTDKVRIKLNAVENTVKDKRVIMVDDSIVRGTTSALIVKLIKEAGAKEVHVRISAPPFLYPCYYGTDVDSQENLIACHNSIEEIKEIIGADSLGYLSIENALKIADNFGKNTFCAACFNGTYPIL